MGSIVEYGDDFPVKKILKVLADETACKYWKIISKQLEISQPVTEKLHLDLVLEKKMYSDVFEDILLIWQMKFKSEATLEKLILMLGEQEELGFIKDKLQAITQQNGVQSNLEEIKWSQIELDAKRYVLTKEVRFLGSRRSLASIAANLNERDFTKMLQTHLNDAILGKLLYKSDIEIEIASNTVPDQILYYVPRTLLVRTEIRSDIFETVHEKDVFLVKGIDWSHFSQLTKGQGSDVSTNQIKELTTPFILLESEEHFDKICKLTKKSVHYIDTKNDKQIWVKTRGSIDTIMKHITENEECIPELDIINDRFENHNVSTICIADSPGMGKSVLLANLARIVQMRYPERITIFMYMSELILLVKSCEADANGIKRILAKKLSQNEFGRQLLLKIFASTQYLIEMFIDGFDEILPEDEIQAMKILTSIKEFQNARICVTTRKNLQQKLENSFGVISFNIVPFTNSEKVDFFCEYWNRKYTAQMTNALKAYSQLCLLRLDTKMERDIAGIPLQCRLLAEMLASDAVKQSVRDFSSNQNSSEEISLLKLFMMYMKPWSQIENQEQKSAYKNLALSTIFSTKFPETDGNYAKDDNMLDFSREGLSPRFVHRSFAEYILAVDALSTILNPADSLLGKSGIQHVFDIRYTASTETEFLNPALCIFLDAMVLDQSILKDSNKISNIQDVIKTVLILDEQKIINVIRACAFHQTYGLLCLIYDENQDIKLQSVISEESINSLLKTAVQHAKLNLVKKCCNIISPLGNEDFPLVIFEKSKLMNIDITPLHTAIERGCFKTFEFFAKLYDNCFNKMEGLLHVAVLNTQKLPPTTILEKIEIMKVLLLKEEADLLLRETVGKTQTPLLMHGIHIDLITFLIEEGADVFATTSNQYNFCHFAGSYMNPDDYHELISYLEDKNLDSILKYKNSNHEAAYEIAIRQQQLHPETIALLAKSLSVYADKEHVYRDSLLYHLIKNGYNAPAIHAALQYKSSWNFPMYRDGSTSLLHVSAYWANSDAIDYLIQNGADPNTSDDKYRTPLHVACDRRSTKSQDLGMSNVVSLLLIKGANPNAIDNMGRKPLATTLDQIVKPKRTINNK